MKIAQLIENTGRRRFLIAPISLNFGPYKFSAENAAKIAEISRQGGGSGVALWL